jgi:AMP-polyphosphate phosphotransferase
MFESAELGHKVDDDKYKKEAKSLREQLLTTQFDVLESKRFPVILLVNGVDGAGKTETVQLFNEWLDPRHVRTRAFGQPTDDELTRPPMWRFWQALPAKGKISILFGSWYAQPIHDYVFGGGKEGTLTKNIDSIRDFERLLHDDGALIIKLWFHLSKKAQRKRLKDLESDKLTSWRVTPDDWKHHKRYDDYAKVNERILRDTSTGEAPWVVIDGSDANYRGLAAGRTVLAAMRARLAECAVEAESAKRKGHTRADKKEKTNGKSANGKTAKKDEVTTVLGSVDTAGILRDLPFTERLSKDKYETKIVKVQGRLAKLSRSPKMKKHGVAVVFEGMDAAGKGGAIRRITSALDARRYNVIPIAAPTEEERAQPYLWRFWRHIPRRGQFVIYDRSWYGRVLVERVENFATEDQWTRAYREINDFEEQLADYGIVVVKLWLAITKDEQMKRFKEREEVAYKQFKITEEDWRNRKKWDDYVVAASDMIDRTSSSIAPWTVIEANDKHLARVRVIETISKRLEEEL